jgi:hypothetical protein
MYGCRIYTYDANGNTLSDAQGRSFTWDFENRPTQVIVPGTNGRVAHTTRCSLCGVFRIYRQDHSDPLKPLSGLSGSPANFLITDHH